MNREKLTEIIAYICSKTGVSYTFTRHLKYELEHTLLRCRKAISPCFHKKIGNYRKLKDLKINFGCGPIFQNGWINVDSHNTKGVDLVIDLRSNLPFSDGSAKYIFSEHFIEHLEFPNEALKFLSECHRILSSFGTVRIITPDAAKYIRAYVLNDSEFFSHSDIGETPKIEILNRVFSEEGFHKFCYDYEALYLLLEEAGFRNIVKSNFNSSIHPELRIDFSNKWRQVSSLYMEASKVN